MKPIRLTEDEVATAAQLAGVPPALALAVWMQESGGGRNTKTSPKGAVGAFQVMPATFKRYMPGGDIYDPVDNMHAGLAVLADGLRKSGGDWEGAAQFYYHGAVLPKGVKGPDSGPGTPTTRGYGRQVAARARGRQGGFGNPMPSMALAKNGSFDIGDIFNGGDEQMDIPGYTRPPNNGTMMPMNYEDAQSAQAGSANYDFDRYIRKLIDEEFSNG